MPLIETEFKSVAVNQVSSPAIHIKINQQGLTYVKNVGLAILKEKISEYKALSYDYNSKFLRFWATDIAVAEFTTSEAYSSINASKLNKLNIQVYCI